MIFTKQKRKVSFSSLVDSLQRPSKLTILSSQGANVLTFFLEYSSYIILYYGALNNWEALAKGMVEGLRQELETSHYLIHGEDKLDELFFQYINSTNLI